MPPLWILFVLLPVLGGAERFSCRGRILGAYYADAKSGCKAFHVCVRVAGGGIRDFRFFCPPGTLFHQEAQTCTDWGDDDPLACPADIYDGQFDLYKIGSGYDTKKLSSPAQRDDESEYGLQRAETGDRRLAQNNGASDLRAAHSSDFFSGQRERGRDEPAPAPAQKPQHNSQAPAQSSVKSQHNSQARQSFRRATTPRAPPTTQYTSHPSPSAQNPQKQTHYDPNHKRKLVRKRPVYASTAAPPTTYAQTSKPPQYSESPQEKHHRDNVPQEKQQNAPVNIPPQFKEYKEEYVEVSRVTPKPNKFFHSNPPQATFPQSTPAPNHNYNKNNGLVELYNLDSQSTPGLNNHNNKAFKVAHSFNVGEIPTDADFVRIKNNNVNPNKVRIAPTTAPSDNVGPTRVTASTPAFKNYNSVSYEPEKNNFVPYSKQSYFNSPITTITTIVHEPTSRPEPPAKLNTIAYNTNIGFNTHNSNFAESDEDDGQYRPPQGEDDGQYRPELYERELLSGAHSLNIAASGNRLPEDQKPRGKSQAPSKSASFTAAPRPFRPAPTSSVSTQRVSENYPTSVSPQSQRTFDYVQTYTTTSRPKEASAAPVNYEASSPPVRPSTTLAPRPQEALRPQEAPRSQEARTQTRPPPPSPPTQPPAPPRPTTRPPFFSKPVNKQEDTSYDYAYYDSDPGFSEYDHIEEFGRTKTKQ